MFRLMKVIKCNGPTPSGLPARRAQMGILVATETGSRSMEDHFLAVLAKPELSAWGTTSSTTTTTTVHASTMVAHLLDETVDLILQLFIFGSELFDGRRKLGIGVGECGVGSDELVQDRLICGGCIGKIIKVRLLSLGDVRSKILPFQIWGCRCACCIGGTKLVLATSGLSLCF